jgi:hypothetical protein
MTEQEPVKSDMPPPGDSILTKEFTQWLFSEAQDILETENQLPSFLFLSLGANKQGLIPLTLPETPSEIQDYFTELGLHFLEERQKIREAVLLTNTEHAPREDGSALRRQAITLVGRNAERTQFLLFVQPYHHESSGRVVFDPLAVENYNIPNHSDNGVAGLLDHLFDLFPYHTRGDSPSPSNNQGNSQDG